MNDKYPGIQEEIKAAINIWAHYIGREIKVDITLANLPAPAEYDSEEETMENYYGACPAGIHLVMAETYFTDSAVGKTLTRYSFFNKDGLRKVTEFKRALFLRMPTGAANGEEETNEENEDDEDIQTEQKLVWVSLQKALNKTLTASEILEMMKKRDQKIFMTGKNELLTFKTIVHEFGHVWGLCDQYALGGNSTNCDASFATLNSEGHIFLHDEATMSRSSWMSKLYLADDDIQGIRMMATRKGFIHNWPLEAEYKNIPVNPITHTNALPLAMVRNAKRTMGKVEINMAIATEAAVRIKVRILEKANNFWLEFGDSVYSEPITFSNYNLNLTLGRSYNVSKVEVTFTTFEKKDGVEIPIGEPVVIEKEVENITSITIR